jgi:hypothetical protein
VCQNCTPFTSFSEDESDTSLLAYPSGFRAAVQALEAGSGKSPAPVLAVNCAGISRSLLPKRISKQDRLCPHATCGRVSRRCLRYEVELEHGPTQRCSQPSMIVFGKVMMVRARVPGEARQPQQRSSRHRHPNLKILPLLS